MGVQTVGYGQQKISQTEMGRQVYKETDPE